MDDTQGTSRGALRPREHLMATTRLLLREMNAGDAPFILRLLNEDGFLKFIGDKGVRTLVDARRYIAEGPMASYRQYGFGLYLVSLRHDLTPVGICGLVKRDALPQVDLGFALSSRHWGKGFATESASAVLEHARSALGLEHIVAITALDNRGSMAVLEKLGLRLEGKIRLVAGGPELNLFVARLATLDSGHGLHHS